MPEDRAFYVSDLSAWSPVEEITHEDLKPVLGPELPPDLDAGFWELTYHTDVREVPSLYEVVGVLSEWRPALILEDGSHPISIRWRAP